MSLTSQKARSLGRLELLAWLNRFVGADYAKVEDLRDGIAFVQIFSALYPKKNYLSRLVDDPRAPKDFERNFKALDAIIRSNGVKNRTIDADSLAKGSFKALHELLQWFHWYVETQSPEISQEPEKLRQPQEYSVNDVSDFGDHSVTIVQASSPFGSAADAAYARFDQRFSSNADAIYKGPSGVNDAAKFQRSKKETLSPPPAPDMQAERLKAYRRPAKKEENVQAEEQDDSAIDEAKYVYREIEVLLPALELDLTRELREQTALMATLQEICRERDALFDTLRAVERTCELLPTVEDSAITKKMLEILHSAPIIGDEAAEEQSETQPTKGSTPAPHQVALDAPISGDEAAEEQGETESTKRNILPPRRVVLDAHISGDEAAEEPSETEPTKGGTLPPRRVVLDAPISGDEAAEEPSETETPQGSTPAPPQIVLELE